MAVYSETCSSTEDYERVCESDRIINKKLLSYTSNTFHTFMTYTVICTHFEFLYDSNTPIKGKRYTDYDIQFIQRILNLYSVLRKLELSVLHH
jgi:hypothetical protein